MNYLVLEHWTPLSKAKQQIQELYLQNFDKVVLYGPHEFGYWNACEYWQELVNACRETNHKLYVITGSGEFYQNYPLIECEHEIVYWPTHFFTRTFALLETIRKPIPKVSSYQYHFVCMNYRPRSWRCLLMDFLARDKLLHFNAVSWHHPAVEYDWKFWKPKLLRLSDFGFTQSRNYNVVPNEYHTSFMQLISETTMDTLFVSEKTVTPLFLGKPFLVASVKGFHKYLDKLGFQRYDEIFDYAFDEVEDTTERYNLLLKNLTNLSKIPLNDLPKLKEKIQEKLDFNSKRAYDIVNEYEMYPNLTKEMIDLYHSEQVVLSGSLIDFYKTTFLNK